MTQKIIQIPSFGATAEDFKKKFTIYHRLKNLTNSTISFDFSECNCLHPNAMAFLGGFARLLQFQKNKIIFNWASLKNETVKANLCHSGFAESFHHSSQKKSKDFIPYREDTIMNMNNIMDYLSDSWLGKGWVHVSTMVRDVIVGKVWEIYNNAFEHSGSKIGIFSCGQYLPEKNSLLLSVVDFGEGISSKIRDFFSQIDLRASNFTDARCLMWAFMPGFTTCSEGVPRGLGLDILQEFIKLNQGKLEVYCNGAYGIVDKDGKRFENRDICFDGTIIHITIRCDENLYQFEHETNPLFL